MKCVEEKRGSGGWYEYINVDKQFRENTRKIHLTAYKLFKNP